MTQFNNLLLGLKILHQYRPTKYYVVTGHIFVPADSVTETDVYMLEINGWQRYQHENMAGFLI